MRPGTLRVVSIGFIAADFLTENDGPLIGPLLGGTAANVAVILAQLGHSVSFAGSIGDDVYGHSISRELAFYNVDTDLLLHNRLQSTPFCIQSLRTANDSYVSHAFRTISLDKAQVSSKYKPIPGIIYRKLQNAAPFDVVFLNKQDPRAFEFIQERHFVYYEPDYIDDHILHSKIISKANVVKYNHQQFVDCGINIASEANCLVIETLGGDGLIFREAGEIAWTHLETTYSTVVDPVGAGDWFSASLIDLIYKRSPAGAKLALPSDIVAVLRSAMKTAAAASRHRGALGMLRDGQFAPGILSRGDSNIKKPQQP